MTSKKQIHEFIASSVCKKRVFISRILSFRISWSPETETLKTHLVHTKIILVESFGFNLAYIVKPTNSM